MFIFVTYTDIMLIILEDVIFNMSTCLLSSVFYSTLCTVFLQLSMFDLPNTSVLLYNVLKWFTLLHPPQVLPCTEHCFDGWKKMPYIHFYVCWWQLLVLLCFVTLWFLTCQHSLHLTSLCLLWVWSTWQYHVKSL